MYATPHDTRQLTAHAPHAHKAIRPSNSHREAQTQHNTTHHGTVLAPAAYVHNQKSKMMTYLANMQTDKLFQFMGIKAFLVNITTF